MRRLLPCAQSEVAIQDLDQYPEEPEVHRFLHKRLMAFDVQTLYELHYLMITLGKVGLVMMGCTVCCPYASNDQMMVDLTQGLSPA
jgi:hypothetical protein